MVHYHGFSLVCPEQINLGADVFCQGVKTSANFMWNSIDFIIVKELSNTIYLKCVCVCVFGLFGGFLIVCLF